MYGGILINSMLASQSVQKHHEHSGKTQFVVQVWDGKVSFYLGRFSFE
jgi:hypothetical protein